MTELLIVTLRDMTSLGSLKQIKHRSVYYISMTFRIYFVYFIFSYGFCILPSTKTFAPCIALGSEDVDPEPDREAIYEPALNELKTVYYLFLFWFR